MAPDRICECMHKALGWISINPSHLPMVFPSSESIHGLHSLLCLETLHQHTQRRFPDSAQAGCQSSVTVARGVHRAVATQTSPAQQLQKAYVLLPLLSPDATSGPPSCTLSNSSNLVHHTLHVDLDIWPPQLGLITHLGGGASVSLPPAGGLHKACSLPSYLLTCGVTARPSTSLSLQNSDEWTVCSVFSLASETDVLPHHHPSQTGAWV